MKEGREFIVGSVVHDWDQEDSAMTDEVMSVLLMGCSLVFLTEGECKCRKITEVTSLHERSPRRPRDNHHTLRLLLS